MRKTIAVLVCAAGWASMVAADEGPRPLDAETMWTMKRLATPALSPDGATAVVKVTGYDLETNEPSSDLWLVPTGGDGEPRQLTTHPASESDPAWSPDGRWLAFVAKRDGDDQSQLYVLPIAGGEARRVTGIPTGASAPRWLPDSQRIAFVSRVWPDLDREATEARMKERKESKVSAERWDATPVRWWDRWIDDRQAHVFVVGLDGGEPQAVTVGTGLELPRHEADRSSYDVSPDGREVAFVADTNRDGVDPDLDVWVVPVGGGDARNLTPDNTAPDMAPLYSPDGRWLAFARQTIEGFYGDTRRLVLHDRESGRNRVVTADWDRSADGLVWAPDSSALYGAIDDAGNRRVWRISTGGEVRPVTGERSFGSLDLAAGPEGTPVMVALRQAFTEPPTLVRVDPSTGAATTLTSFNVEILASVDLGEYESVTYEGANGDTIQMWVVYPPGFDRSQQWPLYLLLHGGPHNAVTDSWHWRWNAQVFAGWGLVTGWHNFHGSSGFGQEFTDSINPERAEMPYLDTVAAADWFASQPWIDDDRMAAGGGSYGGYLASVLLGREHPFQALVAHAAVYNLVTQYGADYGASERRHGEHWEQPEQFARNSPHTGAGSFETPTLVIHGQLDYRVPVNHGIELFNTLQNRGVPSRLIYFPDENHWILQPANSIYWYDSKREWLEEYIGFGAEGEE